MTYVCSDIHGEYGLFLKLLQKVGFSSDDEMIICGDVIDKGNDSVKLLKYVLAVPNIHAILGNHEYDFLKYYHALMQLENDYDEVLSKLNEYFSPSDEMLCWDDVDALDALPFYVEREGFVCVHSGVPVTKDNTLQSLRETTAEQLVYDRLFKEPTILPNVNKCVFFGHTPTRYLTNEDKIIKYAKVPCPKSVTDFVKIHLDVGTCLGGGVGCICVETLEEYYIER